MVIKRGEILDRLCAKVGIKPRAKQGNAYLTKRELMQLVSWVDMAEGIINKHRER